MFRSLLNPLRRRAATAIPQVPGRLGRFALREAIGTGSMGVVYRAFDPRRAGEVALKTVRLELLEGRGGNFRAQLRAEARAGAALSHPGIVAVYEYGEAGPLGYLAMEYVEGESLRQGLQQGMSFSPEHAIDLAAQLLAALAHAHERGIWHRDLKPANILVTRAGRVKVTDFGIARRSAAKSGPADDILGTPGFIAPELYVGDACDQRSDLFAAGAVLYQLLAGVPAYQGTRAEVMFKVCCEAPLPPSVAGRRPAVALLDALVLRSLARLPQERFASAAEFREALLEARAQMTRSGT